MQQLGLLIFSYNSANEQLKIDYVRVRRPDGTVVETPLGDLQDMASQITRQAPMYTDYREKHVPVKGLGVGDLLEYQTETQLIHPLIPNTTTLSNSRSSARQLTPASWADTEDANQHHL